MRLRWSGCRATDLTGEQVRLYFFKVRLLLAILVLILPLFAQEPEGWLVPFACGYQPDGAGFNRLFRQYGLPVARERHYGWGMEIRSLVGKNLLIGPMYFRVWDDVANDSFQLRSEAFGIFGKLGLKLPLFQFLTVVPLVGVGGVQPAFRIREVTGDLSIDTLLRSPGKNVSLSPGMKITGLAALELDLMARTKAGTYGIALSGGYLYSPFSLSWRLDNGSQVTGTPDTKIGGPWFSVGVTVIPAPEVITEE